MQSYINSLLRRFSRFLSPSKKLDSTSLHRAILNDQPEVVEKLLQIGHSKTARNDFGLTALTFARLLNRKRCLQLLDPHPPEKRFEFADRSEKIPFFTSIIFEDEILLRDALKRCSKAHRECWIDDQKVWRGIYYQKEIENDIRPKVSIRWIDAKIGYGVFAEENIPLHTFVGEYVGIVQRKKSPLTKNNLYCVRYPTAFMGGKEFTLNAKNGGNFTRYLNHGEMANLDLQSVYVTPLTRMVFLSTREIAKGEQLLFDYGKSYWKQCKQKPQFL